MAGETGMEKKRRLLRLEALPRSRSLYSLHLVIYLLIVETGGNITGPTHRRAFVRCVVACFVWSETRVTLATAVILAHRRRLASITRRPTVSTSR